MTVLWSIVGIIVVLFFVRLIVLVLAGRRAFGMEREAASRVSDVIRRWKHRNDVVVTIDGKRSKP